MPSTLSKTDLANQALSHLATGGTIDLASGTLRVRVRAA